MGIIKILFSRDCVGNLERIYIFLLTNFINLLQKSKTWQRNGVFPAVTFRRELKLSS